MPVYTIKSDFDLSFPASLYLQDSRSVTGKGFLSFFDSGNSSSISDTLTKKGREPKNKSAEANREPPGIYCAHCHALLTYAKHASAVEGKHRHIVTNPNGITFKIKIYDKVECKGQSNAISDHSWFTGYAWRVIVCPECSQHIGWSYQKENSPDFYGLIIDKLIDSGKI